MTTLAEVEQALASVSERSGVIIVGPDLSLLATRPPLPGGGAVLIVLGGATPPHFNSSGDGAT